MLKTKSPFIFLSALLLFLFWGGLLLYITHLFKNRIEANNLHMFRKATSILEEKMASYIHGLQGLGGTIIALKYEPKIEDIHRYAQFRNYFDNFPGAIGFGFIRHVKAEQLESYLTKMKKQDPYFVVKNIGQDKNEYYLVEAFEPYENTQARGYNLASEKERRTAAQLAAQKDIPTLTAPINLVRFGLGFIIYYPIYRTIPTPINLKEKEKSFFGWSYTAITAESVLLHLQSRVPDKFSFAAYDVTDRNQPKQIWLDDTFNNEDNVISHEIKIGGRTWLISSSVHEAFSNRTILLLEIITWLFMSLASLGLLLYFHHKFLITQNKIQSIESWQKAVLDGTTYPIIATDTQGLITLMNPAAEKLLGYSTKELIHKKTPDLFPIKEEVHSETIKINQEFKVNISPGFETFIFHANRTGEPHIQEWNLLNKNQDKIPVKLSLTVIKNKKNEPIGYLGVLEDLREIKKMSSIIEQQRMTLVQAAKMSALGEMASGIAHEINNPLAIISGRVSLLLSDIQSQPLSVDWIQPELKKIESTVFRINKIINGLRSFARDGSQDGMEIVSIQSILDSTLDLCKEKLLKNHIEVRLLGELESKISCNPVQISQVLMNLIGNSFDAIVEQDKAWIEIEVKRHQSKILLTVTDSGNGIGQEVAQRIMEPFYTTKEIGKGTGLGLSISKGIIERHHGTLSYNHHASHTQFVIELPIEPT